LLVFVGDEARLLREHSAWTVRAYGIPPLWTICRITISHEAVINGQRLDRTKRA
jgi:hypothetical protein